MTLKEYGKRLEKYGLRIKTYNGIAGIFSGHNYIMRIEQGEIYPFSEYHAYVVDGQESQRLARRGRISVARQLYGQKLIKQKDIAKLS